MNDDKFWDQDAPYNQDTDGDRRAETSPSPRVRLFQRENAL